MWYNIFGIYFGKYIDNISVHWYNCDNEGVDIVRGRNIKDVQESNKALLYECVRRNGRITLAALMEITNLSRETVD